MKRFWMLSLALAALIVGVWVVFMIRCRKAR